MTSGQTNGKGHPKILPGSWRVSWKNRAEAKDWMEGVLIMKNLERKFEPEYYYN